MANRKKNLRPDALPVGGYDEYCFADLLSTIPSSKRNARGRVATIISITNVSTQCKKNIAIHQSWKFSDWNNFEQSLDLVRPESLSTVFDWPKSITTCSIYLSAKKKSAHESVVGNTQTRASTGFVTSMLWLCHWRVIRVATDVLPSDNFCL